MFCFFATNITIICRGSHFRLRYSLKLRILNRTESIHYRHYISIFKIITINMDEHQYMIAVWYYIIGHGWYSTYNWQYKYSFSSRNNIHYEIESKRFTWAKIRFNRSFLWNRNVDDAGFILYLCSQSLPVAAHLKRNFTKIFIGNSIKFV